VVFVRYGLASVITLCYPDNMIRTQISVDAKMYTRAKQVARQQGISVAELCRRALAETLARQPTAKPWMAYAGVLDGRPEDSASIDEVVYDRPEL